MKRSGSVLYTSESSVNTLGANPPVHVTLIIGYLNSRPLDRAHKVKILGPLHLAENDVPFGECFGLHWLDRAKLT